jgi:hypothetical protein
LFADLSLECLTLKDVIDKKALKRELFSYLPAQFPPTIQDSSAEQHGGFLSALYQAYSPDLLRVETQFSPPGETGSSGA